MAYTNIDDPSAYFQTKIYTGDGNNNRAITNDGNSDLQPDFIWLKDRNVGFGHRLTDSTRGITKNLASETAGAESTSTTQYASWNTDGFTLIYGGQQVPNYNGHTYVAWQWKANGGTTASNTDGSITSTVQANTDAGFSIVTWTGNTTGSSQTIGHGLGAAPKTIIVKDRDSTAVWVTYHEVLGTGKYLVLNTSAAEGSISNYWGSTAPSSTVFGVIGDGGGAGYANNVSGNNMIAYAFAEKQGYSKFGKYVGNGVSNNGPFVYLGFKPRFIMIKSTTATGSHVMWDSKRSPFNGMDDYLVAAEADAEGTNGIFTIDAVSNGFKIRNTGANNGLNQSGTKYVYYAFAENPFTTSTGIPTTAR